MPINIGRSEHLIIQYIYFVKISKAKGFERKA